MPVRLRAGDLEEIAELLCRVRQDDAFAAAAKLRQDGVGWRDVLGAVLLAGVREIEPWPVGFKFHCVMMVGSAYQLAEAAEPDQRWLPVFYNLADFKRAQAQDAAQNDWTQAPPPAVAERELRIDRALPALRRAVLGDDVDLADRAAVAVHACCNLHDAFEVLWPLAARDYNNIGHKMIYAAQAWRALQQIGWRHGLPVLRSLVRALLAPGGERGKAPFAASRELAQALRADWALGSGDASASAALLAALRLAEPQAAAARTAAALSGGDGSGVRGGGIGLAATFDALRLYAAEQMLQRPGIIAVHPTTVVNAFAIASDASVSDATRRLLVLQAAAWLGLFAQDLRLRDGGARIDALAPDGAEGDGGDPELLAAAAVRALAEDRAAGAARMLACARQPGGAAALAAALRTLLLQKVREHHDYKYVAAVLEEQARAHPRWAPHLLAAAAHWLPSPMGPDAPAYSGARAALQ